MYHAITEGRGAHQPQFGLVDVKVVVVAGAVVLVAELGLEL